MGKATQVEQGVTADSLKPLSPEEIFARDEAHENSNDPLSVLEEWFPDSAPASLSKRGQSKISEIDAKAEAEPFTRAELEAKKAAAEIRHPDVIATPDGQFVRPVPLVKAPPPAPTVMWD